MTKIAVLITCFNRKSQTIECLTNLYNQVGYKTSFIIDVFLVDDGSTDGTSGVVSAQFPEVKIISGDGTLFWNRGMNKAWAEAGKFNYDYFLWLNDDTDIFPDAVGELLYCTTQFTGPVLVCGAINSKLTGEFTYGGSTAGGQPLLPNGTIQHCKIINGNCVLVNKESFDLIGNLDPIFPHAIGDHDYGLRLVSMGGTLLTTTKFVGNCEKNARLPRWCYPTTPFLERLQVLYSPIGNAHPNYYFRYENRHFGFITALKHYLSIHLRVLFPSLWN